MCRVSSDGCIFVIAAWPLENHLKQKLIVGFGHADVGPDLVRGTSLNIDAEQVPKQAFTLKFDATQSH